VPSGFERFFRDFGCPARLDDVFQEAEIQRVKAKASEYRMELARVHEPDMDHA
jgi:hypothetical protein